MAVTSKLSGLLKKFLKPALSKISPQTALVPKGDDSLRLAIRNLGAGLEQSTSASARAESSTRPIDELECVRQQICQIAAPVASVTPVSMSDQACEMIDQEMLHQICQYDDGMHGDTLTELIRLFLELTPKRIESLKRALEEKNWHCVSREAHSLKSSSANLGLKKVTGVCRKLEAIENHPDYSMASALLSEIENEYQAAARSLMELLKQRTPTRKVAA